MKMRSLFWRLLYHVLLGLGEIDQVSLLESSNELLIGVLVIYSACFDALRIV